jgi:ribosome-interacting GTPase 1
MTGISEISFGGDLLKSLEEKGITLPKRIKNIRINMNANEAIEIIYTTIPDKDTLEAIMAFLVSERVKETRDG